MPSTAWQFTERSPLPAPAVLGAVGVGAFGVTAWNLGHELAEMGVGFGPLVAAAMGVSLSVGVLLTSYRIHESDFDTGEEWVVTLSALAAGAFTATGFGLTVAVRALEGRTVSEPAFPLVVIGTLGVLAGAVIGHERVEQRRLTDAAQESRDAMAFVNSLLRHDVRNALQIISGHAELLARNDDDAVRESGAAIGAQTTAVTQLVTEVESVTAVLTDDLDVTTGDLSLVLEDVIETAQEGHPGATIEYDLADGLPVAGAEALYSVFRNLLDNAISHAGTDSVRIRVRADRDGDRVRVRVADNGQGIPEADRERIFQQGVSSDGGGHGLYVAETIVDRLGGDIRTEDSDLGGAAFVVTLQVDDPSSAEEDVSAGTGGADDPWTTTESTEP